MRQEFELAYNNSVVQRFNHYTTKTTSLFFLLKIGVDFYMSNNFTGLKVKRNGKEGGGTLCLKK